MNDTPFGFTLTEARALAGRPRFWVVFAGVAAVLALTGPFGTYDAFSLAERALYWGLASFGSLWLGFFTSMTTATQAEDWGAPPALALCLGGLAAGIPIACLFGAMDALFQGAAFVGSAWTALPYAAAISLILGVIYEVIEARDVADDTDPPAPASSSPDWLAKLPAELGRDLVSLQAQDHYVLVRTMGGETLVRSSLSEAESALGDRGLRVHRSWWVASRHMQRLVYRKGAPRLLLSQGDTLPVGRAYRKAVRNALSSP